MNDGYLRLERISLLLNSVLVHTPKIDKTFAKKLYDLSVEMLIYIQEMLIGNGLAEPTTRKFNMNTWSEKVEILLVREFRDQMLHIIDGIRTLLRVCTFN